MHMKIFLCIMHFLEWNVIHIYRCSTFISRLYFESIFVCRMLCNFWKALVHYCFLNWFIIYQVRHSCEMKLRVLGINAFIRFVLMRCCTNVFVDLDSPSSMFHWSSTNRSWSRHFVVLYVSQMFQQQQLL